MKKYHIADILTLCKVICTGILGVLLLVRKAKPQTALIIFGIGELCDAFDGICARRWKYPRDGKYRWWREYAPQIDQITDVAHLIAMALFFIFRICAGFTYFRPWIAFSVALAVGFICIAIQVITFDPKYKGTRLATCLILGRRILYLACIAFIILVGLYAVTWPDLIKNIIIGILCVGGICLAWIKRNRLTQVKTPLE